MVESELSKEELEQRAYYDSIAQHYDKHYANRYALAYRYDVYDLVMADLDLNGKRVLDAMCGGGEGTGYLMGRGADVTGQDISEECCRLYQKRYPKGTVVCSSILHTQFPDSHFDAVLTDSLHHIHPNLQQGLNELYRILKPGGHLCCWEPNAASFINIMRKIWYKLDNRFFQVNEQAIDFGALKESQQHHFDCVKIVYGGNVAYFFVNCSMAFRIPLKLVEFYAPAFIKVEKLLNRFQPSSLSPWALCLIKKASA